jgi:hypothetical protein
VNRRRERLVTPAWREAWASASCLGALVLGLVGVMLVVVLGVLLWWAGWL